MSGVDFRLRPFIARPPRAPWLVAALAGAAAPLPFSGEAGVDVCIIGGGFSGLWTALRLREQDAALSIAVLEADRCGTGASGRNSGAAGHWWTRLPLLLKCLGREGALAVIAASEAAVEDIHGFVAQHGIACEARFERSVWAATAPGRPGAWGPMFRAAEAAGVTPPQRPVPAEELRALYGDAPYFAGVMEERATRLDPAALARGLRRVALAQGIAVHEGSAVTRLASADGHVLVETRGGRIRAQQVVLAANAWMAQLAPFRDEVMVLSSDMVATDAIPQVLAARGLAGRPGGTNSRMMLNYGGVTPAGQVYLGRGAGVLGFGARIGAGMHHAPRQLRELAADFRHLYPELHDQALPHGWGGPIDRSTTGMPQFGTLAADPRIHYAIGYTGHGVGATALCGRVLASAVLGKRDRWHEIGALLGRVRNGRYPPEPLRYLAASVVQAAVRRKEIAERDGRKPSRLDVKLAPWALATLPARR